MKEKMRLISKFLFANAGLKLRQPVSHMESFRFGFRKWTAWSNIFTFESVKVGHQMQNCMQHSYTVHIFTLVVLRSSIRKSYMQKVKLKMSTSITIGNYR